MDLSEFFIYYNGRLYIWGIHIDRMPRSINQRVLKSELLPKYFGPTADLSSHKYNFKPDDLMDNTAEVR
jgi:hypothetical protein